MKMARKQIWVDPQLYTGLEQYAKPQGVTVDEAATKLLQGAMNKLPKPMAKLYDMDNVIVQDLIVPARAWDELGNLVLLKKYKDLGEPIREGIRLVIQRNAESLLQAKTRIGARMIAEAANQ
jgi:hypothetical protein